MRIVDDNMWEAVQERFRKNNRKPWRQATGRKPRFMLSRLGRCSMCGGPMHAKNAKFGKSPVQLYVCGYYQDRAACTNSLRRPVSEIDTKCVDWIKANVLREEVVLDILGEVRKRVVNQTKDSASEVNQLEKQSTELRREIANLAEAIAVTKGNVSALTPKLTERQERLSAIEARLSLLKAAPDVFSLEVRRIEAGVRKRIDQLHELLGRDVEEARKVLESLLDGPMKFTPVETPDGRRYEVTGKIATGDVLRVLSGPTGGPKKEADTARTKPYPQGGRPRRDSNPC